VTLDAFEKYPGLGCTRKHVKRFASNLDANGFAMESPCAARGAAAQANTAFISYAWDGRPLTAFEEKSPTE